MGVRAKAEAQSREGTLVHKGLPCREDTKGSL